MHHTIKLEYGDSITIYAPDIPPTKVEIAKKNIETEELAQYEIFDRVCKAFDMPIEDILGKRKNANIVLARMVITYDLMVNHQLQVTTVSRLLCKHHTSAMYYFKTIKDLLDTHDSKLLNFQKQIELYEKD